MNKLKYWYAQKIQIVLICVIYIYKLFAFFFLNREISKNTRNLIKKE